MSWFITNLISALLLPPLNLLLLLALAIWGAKRHPKTARFFLICSFGLFWLFSTPYFAEAALYQLEANSTALSNPPAKAQAIVILGGGSYFHPPEYANQDTVSDATLVRLRYGARLYRQTQLPILVTGGKPLGNGISEAIQMKTVLDRIFRSRCAGLRVNQITVLKMPATAFNCCKKPASKKFIWLHTHGISREQVLHSSKPALK